MWRESLGEVVRSLLVDCVLRDVEVAQEPSLANEYCDEFPPSRFDPFVVSDADGRNAGRDKQGMQ